MISLIQFPQLFVLLALVLAVMISLKYPKFGIALVGAYALLSPSGGYVDSLRLFRIGPLPLTPEKVVLLVTLLAITVEWWRSRRDLKSSGQVPPTVPSLPFWQIFMIFFVLSAIISLLSRWSFPFSILEYLMLILGVLFLGAITSTVRKQDIHIFVTLFVVAGTIISLIAILQVVTGFNYLGMAPDSGAPGIYRVSVVGHPVVAGSLLAAIIPMTLHRLINRQAWQGVIYFLAIFLQSEALILTYARSAWGAVIIGVTIYFLGYVFQRNIKAAKTVLVGMLITAFLLVSNSLWLPKIALLVGSPYQVSESHSYMQAVKERLSQQQVFGSVSYTHRLSMYKAIPEILGLKRLLIGFGIGSAKVILPERGYKVDTADNLFLTLLLETGVIGLILFAFPIFAILWRATKPGLKLWADDISQLERDRLGLTCGICSMLITGMFYDLLLLSSPMYIFWSLLGFLLILSA